MSLGSVAVVRGDNPTELPLTADWAVCLWSERTIEDIVFSPGTPVRSFCIVVRYPRSSDVVELASTEAHKNDSSILFSAFR